MRADSDPRRYRCSLLGERRGRSIGHRGRTRRERGRFRPPRGGAGQRCSARRNTLGIARRSIRFFARRVTRGPDAGPGRSGPDVASPASALRASISPQGRPLPPSGPRSRHPRPRGTVAALIGFRAWSGATRGTSPGRREGERSGCRGRAVPGPTRDAATAPGRGGSRPSSMSQSHRGRRSGEARSGSSAFARRLSTV